jgi:hypothetical protein
MTACVSGAPTRRPRLGDERGDAILGWFIKIAVVLGLVGIALFDAISIGSTAVTIADQGSYAARAASEVWQQEQDLQKTYAAAVAAAQEENADNTVAAKDFRVDEDGTVHLTVARTAPTIVVRRIGPLANWAHVRHTSEGRSVA